MRPRRLLRHEFEAEVEVDCRRLELCGLGDELFAAVMSSTAKMKREALARFEAHNVRVKKFLEEHRGYFARKRAHLLETAVLNHGCGRGGAPRSASEMCGTQGRKGGRPAARAIVLAAGMLILLQGCALAMGPEHKVVLAIIGEAEGEGYEGMLAVAGALRNRGNLRGVYGLRARRVIKHLYSRDTYLLAQRAWKQSKGVDESNGATGWGNEQDVDRFCSTSWWKNCVVTARIGNHWFYRRR